MKAALILGCAASLAGLVTSASAQAAPANQKHTRLIEVRGTGEGMLFQQVGPGIVEDNRVFRAFIRPPASEFGLEDMFCTDARPDRDGVRWRVRLANFSGKHVRHADIKVTIRDSSGRVVGTGDRPVRNLPTGYRFWQEGLVAVNDLPFPKEGKDYARCEALVDGIEWAQ